MGRGLRWLLLAGCVGLSPAPALAQATAQSPQGQPPARLIKPPKKAGSRTGEKARPRRPSPVDDRCKPLKQELEVELARPGNPHKIFEARLARNAGTRLCRVGQVEKGMAEFRKGLSYLDDGDHP